MPPLADYLRSAHVLLPESPSYDAAGRQLPFQESPQQRRERLALLARTRIGRRSHSSSSSTSSSESPSPRTPASPLDISHTHTPLPHKQDLDAHLTKLAIAAASASPPQNRQHRNYKNLHLPSANTTSFKSSNTPQPPLYSSARGIFDSSSHTYPSTSPYPPRADDDGDELLAGGEPYILYSSTLPKRPLSAPSAVANSTGIGGFPCRPPPRSQTSLTNFQSFPSRPASTIATTAA